MLRIKKITEEILPKSRKITDTEKELFKTSCNDGYIFYYSRHNLNEMFCLKCNHKFNLGVIEGSIHCPNCGNENIREHRYRYDTKYIRSLEIIDGFFVIKDSMLDASETMDGLTIKAKDIAALVIQNNGEFAVFENRGTEEFANWTRVKAPKSHFLSGLGVYLRAKISLWVDNPAFYDGPSLSIIEKDLKTRDIAELYECLSRAAKSNVGKAINCPKFDESLLKYEAAEHAGLENTLHNKVEYLPNNMILLHTWCAKCGKYGQKLFKDRVDSNYQNRCVMCHNGGMGGRCDTTAIISLRKSLKTEVCF